MVHAVACGTIALPRSPYRWPKRSSSASTAFPARMDLRLSILPSAFAVNVSMSAASILKKSDANMKAIEDQIWGDLDLQEEVLSHIAHYDGKLAGEAVPGCMVVPSPGGHLASQFVERREALGKKKAPDQSSQNPDADSRRRRRPNGGDCGTPDTIVQEVHIIQRVDCCPIHLLVCVCRAGHVQHQLRSDGQ